MVEFYILFILLGFIVGSFLSVCILRIPQGEAITYLPLQCQQCGSRLKAFDKIPVFMYLILKGRCRHCYTAFYPKYTTVQILTAGVYGLLYYKYGLTVEFLAAAYLMSVLIIVFFIDLEHKIIPDKLTAAGLLGGIFLYIYHLVKGVTFYGDNLWYTPLLGIIAGSGILFLIAVISFLIYKTDDGIGMGDVKIFAPIGMFLGWKLTLLVFFISVVTGALAGIFLLASRIKKRNDVIPFGPFIVIGVLIALLRGWEIIQSYLLLYL